jgi:hypothetical protein
MDISFLMHRERNAKIRKELSGNPQSTKYKLSANDVQNLYLLNLNYAIMKKTNKKISFGEMLDSLDFDFDKETINEIREIAMNKEFGDEKKINLVGNILLDVIKPFVEMVKKPVFDGETEIGSMSSVRFKFTKGCLNLDKHECSDNCKWKNNECKLNLDSALFEKLMNRLANDVLFETKRGISMLQGTFFFDPMFKRKYEDLFEPQEDEVQYVTNFEKEEN